MSSTMLSTVSERRAFSVRPSQKKNSVRPVRPRRYWPLRAGPLRPALAAGRRRRRERRARAGVGLGTARSHRPGPCDRRAPNVGVRIRGIPGTPDRWRNAGFGVPAGVQMRLAGIEPAERSRKNERMATTVERRQDLQLAPAVLGEHSLEHLGGPSEICSSGRPVPIVVVTGEEGQPFGYDDHRDDKGCSTTSGQNIIRRPATANEAMAYEIADAEYKSQRRNTRRDDSRVDQRHQAVPERHGARLPAARLVHRLPARNPQGAHRACPFAKTACTSRSRSPARMRSSFRRSTVRQRRSRHGSAAAST
jgi:hypothetical protein